MGLSVPVLASLTSFYSSIAEFVVLLFVSLPIKDKKDSSLLYFVLLYLVSRSQWVTTSIYKPTTLPWLKDHLSIYYIKYIFTYIHIYHRYIFLYLFVLLFISHIADLITCFVLVPLRTSQ